MTRKEYESIRPKWCTLPWDNRGGCWGITMVTPPLNGSPESYCKHCEYAVETFKQELNHERKNDL